MVDAADLKSVPKFLGTGSSPVRGNLLVSLMAKYPAFNRCDIGSNPIQGMSFRISLIYYNIFYIKIILLFYLVFFCFCFFYLKNKFKYLLHIGIYS